ncbi:MULTISPECIES: hypothetical protein [Methylosinus]|uniref:Uncharacterized protein n=1 Tax=Methylosinus trichosporium (strain ATCC 35070 / NCIMB 11131 / UNIQEM 75 / OB3b) TaxID=595536 RepID=A0A2D2D2C0_METT3|nr:MULTISPECIES: hypothetical protein [Methylosinus]ATQ69135.1 hypothetical protein CQW49_15555 [Methylosinus trichosporium OB3b]OBS53559.1 hypothetical protein A8B73_05005 [Methylosinus sp. 3S-1]
MTPKFLSTLIGLGIGAVIVSVAFYFAVRPYLRHDFSASRMPDTVERDDDTTVASQLLDRDSPLGDA